MADIGSTVKKTWMRGMETIGDAFDKLAASTRLRVTEMNLSNQRKEILDGFGARAYQLWLAGAVFPKELEDQLRKVAELEHQLAEVRAARLQSLTPEGTAAEPAGESRAKAEEPAEAGEAAPELPRTEAAEGEAEAAPETAGTLQEDLEEYLRENPPAETDKET